MVRLLKLADIDLFFEGAIQVQFSTHLCPLWSASKRCKARFIFCAAFSMFLVAILVIPSFAQTSPPTTDSGQTPPATSTPPFPPTGDSTPPEDKPERLQFGPEVGFYLPTSGKTADAFGSTFTNIGLGLGAVRKATNRGEYNFDLNIITNRRHGSDFTLIPVGAAWRRSLGNTENASISPYFGYGLNVIGAQLQSDRYNLPSRFRFGASASIFTGVNFGESAYIQARYYETTQMRGFDLSGTSLSIGIRF